MGRKSSSPSSPTPVATGGLGEYSRDVPIRSAEDSAGAAAQSSDDDRPLSVVLGGSGGGGGEPSSESIRGGGGGSKRPKPSETPFSGDGAAEKGRDNMPRRKKRRRRRIPTTYRWVGEGAPVEGSDGTIEYESVELTIGGRSGVVSVGDCALLCSGDIEEDQLYGSGGGERTIYDTVDEGSREEEALYGGDGGQRRNEVAAAMRGGWESVNMGDNPEPFVALVERLWEEPLVDCGGSGASSDTPSSSSAGGKRGTKKKLEVKEVGGGEEEAEEKKELLSDWEKRKSRMKIRARWFFRKEDIEGLGGTFEGVSRRVLMSTMKPTELVLGDQADENEISTILGRCQVVRRRPTPPASHNGRDDEPNVSVADGDIGGKGDGNCEGIPPGAFVCRYSLAMPSGSAAGSKTVTFTAYDNVGGNEKIEERAAKRHRSAEKDEGEGEGQPVDITEIASSHAPDIVKKRGSGRDTGMQEITDGGGEEVMSERGKAEETGSSTSSGDESDEEAREGGTTSGVSGSSATGDTDSHSTSHKPSQSQPQTPPTSEGSTTKGKILIGSSHQAIVPPVVAEGTYSHRRNPVLVWKPESASEDEVGEYLTKADEVLRAHLKEQGMTIVKYSEFDIFSQDVIDSSNAAENSDVTDGSKKSSKVGVPPGRELVRRKPRLIFRECDIDALLATFHQHGYKKSAALKAVSQSPQDFLILWTQQEKELFDAGFRRYCGSLRMISKGVGTGKSFKQVVDYHYRFKIPYQFRRYRDKKKDQARRMMECIEGRRLRDALLESGEDASVLAARFGSNGGGGGVKKTRNLSKTGGGGPNELGATEQRRLMAKSFLIHVRDTIGLENYLQIVNHLKTFRSKSGSSVSNLKESACDLLEGHPDLLEQFLQFLPKKYRT